jgi:NADH:ubiquinone oxidoreductase subunit F (NADH-binding)/NADH:ubiquinone oxidoreductase subunit E
MILQQLHRIQHEHGYLPRPALVALADRLALPLYRVQELVSFYPHFRSSPPPEIEIHVCRDMSCQLRGAARVTAEIDQAFGQEIAGGRVKVCSVSCLGRCDRAPAVRIHQQAAGDNGHSTGGLTNCFGRPGSDVVNITRQLLAGDSVSDGSVDRDADLPDATPGWKINLYAGQPREQRYQALRRVIEAVRRGSAAADAERDRVIQSALKNAVLLGMGGAGGQAFKKWCEVREAAGQRKFVVCNADESEPGTFKDRELLLRTPHLVVEGILLAGIVLGAERGYLYIRHEYEECIAAVREEIAWAEQQGLCGEDILESGIDLPVEVFVSPGGYICGEQTALIQAIEDKRAEPRNRPPELQTNGLWDMPTLVNNVETLAWAPAIVLLGEESAKSPSAVNCRAIEKTAPATDQSWYGRQGRPFGELAQAILGGDADWQRRHGASPRFPGLRLFSVSGDVERPGVYEVESGITVGELLELCGGVRGSETLKAIAFSGPSGGFTPAVLPRSAWPRKLQKLLPQSLVQIDIRDLQMHINYFRAWDLMLGAGIVVYGQSADLVQQALACQRFFEAESCGKCVPCRIGSTKLAEMAGQIAAGRMSGSEAAAMNAEGGQVHDLTFAMASTAICGLGTVAPNPLVSLLRFFPEEVAGYQGGRLGTIT